jgi:hypothetical protein
MFRVTNPAEPPRQTVQHGAHYSNPSAVLSWNSWTRRPTRSAPRSWSVVGAVC